MITVIAGEDLERKTAYVKSFLKGDTFFDVGFYGSYFLGTIGSKSLLSTNKVVWLRKVPESVANGLLKELEFYDNSSMYVFLDLKENTGILKEVVVFGPLEKKEKRDKIKKLFGKGASEFKGTVGEKRKTIDLIFRNSPDYTGPLGIEVKKLKFLFQEITYEKIKKYYSEDEFLLTAVYDFFYDSSLANRKRLFDLYYSQGEYLRFMMQKEIEEMARYVVFGPGVIKSQFKQNEYARIKISLRKLELAIQVMLEGGRFENVLWDVFSN